MTTTNSKIIKKVISSRRTIHVFSKTSVEESYILEAIQAANYAPCHRRTYPWRFINVKEKTREAIIKILIDKKLNRDKSNSLRRDLLEEKYKSPSHWIIATQLLANSEIEIKEDYAACCCGIQNFMLVLAARQVGTKWSTGEATSNDRIYDLLKIKKVEERIIGLISVGYSKEEPPKIKRPEISNIYREI